LAPDVHEMLLMLTAPPGAMRETDIRRIVAPAPWRDQREVCRVWVNAMPREIG